MDRIKNALSHGDHAIVEESDDEEESSIIEDSEEENPTRKDVSENDNCFVVIVSLGMVDHTKERMKIERFYCSPKNSVTLDKPILLIFKKAPFSLLWLILCYSARRAIYFTFRLNNFLPVTLCVRSKKLIIKIRLFTYFLYLPLNSRSKF